MIWRITLTNLPFLIALFGVEHLPELLQTLFVGALLFLVPGLAWVDRRGADAFVVLYRVILTSLVISLVVWLVTLIVPGPADRIAFVLLLAFFTNWGLRQGFLRGYYQGAPLLTPPFRVLALCAGLFFCQSFVGATSRVPALEDHDMETQGTAYGLIHYAAPTMVTNRGRYHFFAHPLLLHFWIGESALITNDLDSLRYYHEGSLAVRDLPGMNEMPELDGTGELAQFADRIKKRFSISQASRELLDARWEQDFKQFTETPILLPTRLPTIWLAAFTLFPLGFLVYRLSGSLFATTGASVIYMTFPEVYVRSAYGGYMAVTNFFTLSATYFYFLGSGSFRRLDGEPELALHTANRSAFSAGFLAAWANQKALLVPAAAALHASLGALLDGHLHLRNLWRRLSSLPAIWTALVLGIGFLVGWATFAGYGLVVAPRDFIGDHVLGHILARIRLNNVNLSTAEQGFWVYPSILALWQQYAEHLNWLFAISAGAALVWAVRRIREPAGLFLIWFLIGAVGFSLVDWRMTKHLSKLIPPLVVLTALFWASLKGYRQHILTAVLVIAVGWNLWTISRLMGDFTYLQPLPIW